MTLTPDLPSLPPGRWVRTQTHAGKVLQYAWRCPGCRRIEWVLREQGMAAGQRREWCPQCQAWQTVRDA